jgi:spermidine synthase
MASDTDVKLLTLADVTQRPHECVQVLESADTDPAVLCEQLQAGDYDKPFLIDDPKHRALCFEIGGAVQSEMLLDDPVALVCDYTRKMMGFLLFCPQPRHILMVGLGGGSLLKYCHLHLPQARVTAVEIDANVIAMRSHFRIPPDDCRLTVAHADGAQHLADMVAAGERTDVLLVDAFDRRGLSRSVATSAFLENARRVLAHGGVFVMNLDATDTDSAEVERMMRSVFGDPVITVVVGWGGNAVAFAGPALSDRGRLADVPSHARRVREGLGLRFPRLPALIWEYLRHGQPSPAMGGAGAM